MLKGLIFSTIFTTLRASVTYPTLALSNLNNGDGLSDIVVGAHLASPLGRSTAGSSYVIFGQNTGFAPTLELSTLNGINGFRINGSLANERSGNSVAGAGDVNGDGKKDLIIGA